MAGSYVLVTAAAVLVVEAVAVLVVIPGLLSESDMSSRVQFTAGQLAGVDGPRLIAQSTRGASPGGLAGEVMGDPGVSARNVVFTANGIDVPRLPGNTRGRVSAPAEALVSTDGRLLDSSYPARFPRGARVDGLLPKDWQAAAVGTWTVFGTRVDWAAAPVLNPPATSASSTPPVLPSPPTAPVLNPNSPKPQSSRKDQGDIIGWVYVDAPAGQAPPLPLDSLSPLLRVGVIVLAGTIPVGVLFGLLTTRGLIRRLRRLADGTAEVAGGNLEQRVKVSGGDEVGRLERHFNLMAERLATAMEEQRALAETNARLAERSRITRELHDSISQDLFSLSALAAGLRQALPAGSPLQPQVATLASTTNSMSQEMRALLLELRPSALEKQGLAPALEELCDTYQARVGITVRREISIVRLGAASEQALFRVAQEGLANAARHSDAGQVELSLREMGDRVELELNDDGRGFDAEQNRHGMGLTLMAERVEELGGSLEVESSRGRGTRVLAALPAEP
jgi:signal transduction histidine kinase